MRRAQEMGLPYKTYAGVRASTGHDLIGFLFSSNALRVTRTGDGLPQDRSKRLASLVKTERIALAVPPLLPSAFDDVDVVDRSVGAPGFELSWTQTRDRFRAVFAGLGQSGDRFIIIGDQAIERDWVAAAQAAGYVPASEFFSSAVAAR